MNILTTTAITKKLKDVQELIEYKFSMNKKPRVVTITGANGFLATHILQELCKLPEVDIIYCLVRNVQSINYDHKKLQIIKYSGIESFDIKNIELNDYLNNTDCFIHCAAAVHNIKSFDSLYSSNVEFSHSILNKIKSMKLSLSFHLISTLSVYASSSNDVYKYDCKEIQLTSPKNILINSEENYHIIGGYAQTKWLSEYIFSLTNAHIIRLGLLTPSYKHPKFNKNEFITRLINLIIQTNSIPFEQEEEYKKIADQTLVDITPVDFAAQCISQLISNYCQVPYKEEVIPFISHIANSSPLSLWQMTKIIQETKNIQLFNLRKDKWTKHLSEIKLGSLDKKLLTHTFFRNELKNDNYKYFNIDLFQSSLYNWSPYCQYKIPLESKIIFHKYLKDLNV